MLVNTMVIVVVMVMVMVMVMVIKIKIFFVANIRTHCEVSWSSICLNRTFSIFDCYTYNDSNSDTQKGLIVSIVCCLLMFHTFNSVVVLYFRSKTY